MQKMITMTTTTEILQMKIIELKDPNMPVGNIADIAVAPAPDAIQEPVEIKRIYCDMDGVIADFAKGVAKIFPEFQEGVTEANKKLDGKMWSAISRFQKEGGKFWLQLDPMPDAQQLWKYITSVRPGEVYILSAAGQPQFGAAAQKVEWLKQHFPIEESKIIIVQRAVEKAQYAKPDAALIDDKRKALDPWEAAGGKGVWHKNAAGSIQQLLDLGVVPQRRGSGAGYGAMPPMPTTEVDPV